MRCIIPPSEDFSTEKYEKYKNVTLVFKIEIVFEIFDESSYEKVIFYNSLVSKTKFIVFLHRNFRKKFTYDVPMISA